MPNIQLVGDYSFLLENVSDCDNPGPACFGCPAFDACDNHDALDDQ